MVGFLKANKAWLVLVGWFLAQNPMLVGWLLSHDFKVLFFPNGFLGVDQNCPIGSLIFEQ